MKKQRVKRCLEKVDGRKVFWQFGNSVVGTASTLTAVAALWSAYVHVKRRTISVWSIFCIFSILLLFIVWHCLKSLSFYLPPPPPTPPFNYQVVLHFVSIDSFQLVSMLQGLPYICLVHHIAVVNPHVLLFPWILNWKRWSGFISCLLSPWLPSECSW